MLSYFGDWRLVDIGRQDVIEWLSWLDESQHQAPETRARIRRLIGQWLQAAVNDDLLTKNVVRKTKAPTIEHGERRFITPLEALLIEKQFDPWWQLVIPTLYDVAVRIGELAKANVSDVLIYVHQGKRTVSVPVYDVGDRAVLGGSLIVRKGKTAKATRVVPTITSSTAQRLVAQILERSQSPSSPLFAGRRGVRMNTKNWRRRAWTDAMLAAGLITDEAELAGEEDDDTKPTPHAMRHGGISAWIAAGTTDVFMLAKWAGHADERMIHKLYGNLLPHDAAPML